MNMDVITVSISPIAILCLVAFLPQIDSTCVDIEGNLSCLDFNCSLSWSSVDGGESSGNYVYTVYYAKRFTTHDQVQAWEVIGACTNVTSTECYVGELFQTNVDFRGNKRFKIDYVDLGANGTHSCTGRKFQRDPLKSVVLSAPSVTHLHIKAEEISFRLTYPTIHRYPDLDLELLRTFVNHKYHVLITETFNNSILQDYEITESLDSRQRIFTVKPATNYIISVKSAVFPPEIWSPDTTTLPLKTLEKAPSRGPYDCEIVNTSFACVEPDVQNAVVRWKAPDKIHWNGELSCYEVRIIVLDSRKVKNILRVEAHTTELILEGLSRWKNYEIQIFANNSGGGTRNEFPLHLEKHVADIRGSKPVDVQITSYQHDVTLIKWQPPIGYNECIMGYAVTWTDYMTGEHHDTVNNATSLEVHGQDILWVRVMPLVRYDYATDKWGEASMYKKEPDRGSKFNPWLLLLVGVVILVVAILAVLVAKRQYIRSKWVKPHFKDNFPLDKNKVLRPLFDRQISYEPCIRQEKEIFDSPSPGVNPNGNSLPPCSPDHPSNTQYSSAARRRSCDVSAMTSLLHDGKAPGNDLDAFDSLEGMRNGSSSSSSSSGIGSNSNSKTDSAIDLLSCSDDDRGVSPRNAAGVRQEIGPVAPSKNDGYILHCELRDHLRASEHIGDYTITDLSGTSTSGEYQETPFSPGSSIDAYSKPALAQNSEFGKTQVETHVLQEDSRQASPKQLCVAQPSISTQKFNVDAPYVLHSDLGLLTSTTSGSDKSESSMADYSKQALACDGCVPEHCVPQTQNFVNIPTERKTPEPVGSESVLDQKRVQTLKHMQGENKDFAEPTTLGSNNNRGIEGAAC